MPDSDATPLSLLLNRVLTEATINADNTEMFFTATTGERWHFWHESDCCESVNIEDVIGDLQDLVGSPILMCEEVTSDEHPPDKEDKSDGDSFTWTFYKFRTMKGSVTVRWYGCSNGYYSERVTVRHIPMGE